jgi:hypothetical protein
VTGIRERAHDIARVTRFTTTDALTAAALLCEDYDQGAAGELLDAVRIVASVRGTSLASAAVSLLHGLTGLGEINTEAIVAEAAFRREALRTVPWDADNDRVMRMAKGLES